MSILERLFGSKKYSKIFIFVCCLAVLLVFSVLIFLTSLEIEGPKMTDKGNWSSYIYENGDIQWVEKIDQPIKTVRVPSLDKKSFLPIKIFKLGVYLKGPFKGEFLSLATVQTSSEYSKDPLTDYRNEEFSIDWLNSYSVFAGGVGSYILFVSDRKGNVIAWCDKCLSYHEINDAGPLQQFLDVLGMKGDRLRDQKFMPVTLTKDGFDKNCFGLKCAEALNTHALFSFFGGYIVNLDLRTFITSQESIYAPGVDIGRTQEGFSILRYEKAKVDDPGEESYYMLADSDIIRILDRYSFFVKFPFGLFLKIYPRHDLLTDSGSANINWTLYSTATTSVKYGEGLPARDCFGWFSTKTLFDDALVETGRTVNTNEPIFEVDQKKYPWFYECLHDRMAKKTLSLKDFNNSHPLFFWRHAFGEIKPFYRLQKDTYQQDIELLD